jgi:hypothetical protein
MAAPEYNTYFHLEEFNKENIMSEVIAAITFAITMVIDGLTRGLDSMEWVTDTKRRKLLLFTVSLLLGILISVGVPGLATEIFRDFYGLGGSLISQIIVGIALGLGSKATYYLIDWIRLKRQQTRLEVSAQALVIAQAQAQMLVPQKE